MEKTGKSYFAMEGNPLAGVNVNTGSQVIKEKYDSWANDYDKDMVKYNYAAPKVAVQLLMGIADKYGLNKKSKICDVGAGTGIIGEMLKKEGFESFDGIDISPEMLEVARKKDCYKKLICAGLGLNQISMTNEYDAVLCIGCITIGHIKPNGLDEMVEMVRPGGILMFTIRQDAATNDDYGYKAKMNELVSMEKMKIISEEKIDYLVALGDNDLARNCYLYVCLKNK